MGAEDVAYTREHVSDWRVVLTLITIRGCLAITHDLSITLANLHILIFMRGILLCAGGFGFTAGFLAIVSGLRLCRA